jgi:hypothetical protein
LLLLAEWQPVRLETPDRQAGAHHDAGARARPGRLYGGDTRQRLPSPPCHRGCRAATLDEPFSEWWRDEFGQHRINPEVGAAFLDRDASRSTELVRLLTLAILPRDLWREQSGPLRLRSVSSALAGTRGAWAKKPTMLGNRGKRPAFARPVQPRTPTGRRYGYRWTRRAFRLP